MDGCGTLGRKRDLLSGRVVELVFTRTLETVLNTTVLPESLDCVADLRGKHIAFNLSGLHEDSLYVIFHSLILKRKLEGLHGLENDAHGLNGVAEDDLLERFPLVARVATLVNELHLLQDGRLSGFTSTCSLVNNQSRQWATRDAKSVLFKEGHLLTQKKHLNLVSLHHLVPLQLVLNLFVTGLALLLLGAHSTTHLDGYRLLRNSRKMSSNVL
jgi:hypothetical protein